MSLFLSSIWAFFLALGILVTVHEFGHFWVARRLGVKVLRFSVGFGKPLLRFQRSADATEYVISAIPLGGYVKMLDEREGEVAEHERHMTFNRQAPWKRIAIACAGPFANVVLAVLFYALVFMVGIVDSRPVIGQVGADSIAAAAGFQTEDEIVAVAGTPVRTWEEARLALLDQLMDHKNFSVIVHTVDGTEMARQLDVQDHKLLKADGDIVENLGLSMWLPKALPVFEKIVAGSAAEKAGLQAGDLVIDIDGKPVTYWRELAEEIAARPGQAIQLQIQRDGSLRSVMVTPESVVEDGKTIGRIGVQSSANLPEEQIERVRIVVQYPWYQALLKGCEKSLDMSVLMLRMVGQLVTGQASAKNISGPITIAEYAGRSASIDVSYYLNFLALISISLAVFNMLPVPLLDGGQVLFCIVEMIKGRPLSEHFEMIGQRIGIAALGCLMVLAFYNDITRLLG